MTYASHVIIAACSASMMQPWLDVGTTGTVLFLALAAFGGLLPDIDHPKSWIGKYVPIIPTLLFKTTGHRGWTHTLFAAFSVFVVFYVMLLFSGIDTYYAFAPAIGYMSHLAADMVSNSGIPLYWPVYKKRIVIPLSKTGDMREYTITIAVFFSSVVFAKLF